MFNLANISDLTTDYIISKCLVNWKNIVSHPLYLSYQNSDTFKKIRIIIHIWTAFQCLSWFISIFHRITFTVVFGASSLKISNTLIFSGELVKPLSRNTARRGLHAAATDSLSPLAIVAVKSSLTVLLTLSSISGICKLLIPQPGYFIQYIAYCWKLTACRKIE